MAPVLLLIVFILTLVYLYRFSKQRPPNFPPGPPRLPVWGSYWLVLLNHFKFTHIGYHKLAQKYRTKILGLHLASFPTVIVSDYENIRQVLTRPQFQGRVKLFITEVRTYNKNLGIIFTDDAFWEQHKRFSLRHLRDFGFGRRFPQLEDIGQEEIQDMLDLLNGRREDKDIFQDGLALIPDLFHTVFFNTLWFMIAGHRFPVKEHSKLRFFTRQALRFQKSIDVTGNAVALTPWLRHFAPHYTGFTDLMEATGNMLKYMEEAVSEHKTTYSEDYMRDFIDCYLKEMKKQQTSQEPSAFTEEQLHVLGIDYLFPASTTVTATLNFAMAFLLNYPEVQTKMQEELDSVVGRDRLPTLDDRTRLPYNEAFLREVMRKETLVPLSVVHRATEDTELGGYSIPKNTVMIVNLWSFHNDPDFWGDPEVFRPERFLDEQGQRLKKDYSLPFGAGKRLCAGETFARHFMFLVVSALLQNFTVKNAPGKPLPSTKADLPGIIVTKKNLWELPKMTTIPKFFQDQDVFITGGTGFLGKVLMEKLLRSCPDVGNIYILIRPKRGKDLNERIEGFTNDALFDTLKREHPNNLKKIVPVLGNLMEHDLGLSSFDHQMLEEKVSIVFHLAATVRFNEPLKNAIIQNTRSTRDIMILARNMKKLKTLIHVSTTYCNCDRPVVEEIVYPAVYDWREMIMMADTVSDEHIINILTKKILGEFPNTYTFTKRLAENVVKDLGVGLPVGIVRPSIVTPTLSEPFIGWVDNINGIHGVGICIFKGILRSLHGSPSAIVNFIPVDTVVKIMCTSSFEVAKSRNKLEPAVYSASNPINHKWSSLVDYSTELANENPLENVIWKPDANMNSNRIYHFMLVLIRQLIPALLFDGILKLSGKKPMLLEIQRKTLLALNEIHYFLNHSWTFKNKNASSLSKQLHSSDKEHFDFDGFEDHDLKEYLSESLSIGVRFFVMKEAKYSTENSRRHYRRMFWLDFIVKVIGVSLAIWCVYHSGYLQNLFHTFHTVWNAEI